ncbi:MAG: Flp family type IVb pilin [Acetobacteraceae bacterium]
MAGALGIESESGVTAIEYGLIAGLIAVAIISAITLVGTNLSGMFNYIATHVKAPGS